MDALVIVGNLELCASQSFRNLIMIVPRQRFKVQYSKLHTLRTYMENVVMIFQSFSKTKYGFLIVKRRSELLTSLVFGCSDPQPDTFVWYRGQGLR